MNISMSYYIRIAIVAVALWVAAAAETLAQGTPAQHAVPEEERRMAQLYNEAIRNYKTDRGVALADSLLHMAEHCGNAGFMLRAYNAKMKHACIDYDDEKGMEAAVKRFMDFALEHNFIEAFYSGVSFKTTYYTNIGDYARALEYQKSMLDYAKRHGHDYGIVIGHVSLGNLYRMRLQLVQAIDEYTQALNAYRKLNGKHDFGGDYRRITECYIIAGHFERALSAAQKGVVESKFMSSVAGLYAYMAFAYFMLDRDSEFKTAYARYADFEKHGNSDILSLIANSVYVMNLVVDGKYDEAQKEMAKKEMGAFKSYVEIGYYKRRGLYDKVLEAMQEINIRLYGDSKGTFTADWARMSAEVNNNLTALDKQRAANINSRLELVSTSLELESTQLELARFKDAEHLALMAAESKRLSLNNQRLLARQLRDSLARQRLARMEKEQKRQSERLYVWTVIGALGLLTALGLRYLLHSTRMTRELKRANVSLHDNLANLSIANRQAQESDWQKTRFIQTMSHEIRTPLNAIVGFSQVLTDAGSSLSEAERENMIQIINNNSDTLNTLINDILDLTSVESGRYVMKTETVAVNNLCHQALDSTRRHKAEGVSLRLETVLPDSFTITSDSYRLRQVLVNLLTNAMKNTAEGSIVLGCSLSERPGMLTFTVTDTGIGVPRDKQKAIFERFCKLDQFKQGAGLGLDICRIIATRLGGAIGIDSSYTGGARFWFAIPM